MSKIYIKVIFILSFYFMISCSDLTRVPLDAPSDVSFFSTPEDLESAINGVYNSLWWQIRGVPALQEIDNATDIGFLRDGPMQPISVGSHTPDESVIESVWTHLYTGISRANNLLDNIGRAQDVVPEERFLQIQAEARYLRAFYYHYLIELFGDVPLLIEVPDVENSHVGKSPKSEIVDQMISDLEFAEQNLEPVWPSIHEGRVTSGAVLALKARVALYNENYLLAIESAQKVMESGVYALYPDYELLFQYEGIRNSEVIFDVPHREGVMTSEIPQRIGGRLVGAWCTNVPSQALIDTYHGADGLPIDQSNVYDPAQPFKNRDPRLDASIIRPQSIFDGYIFESHPDSTETWNLNTNQRVENTNVTNPFASFTGYLFRKYLSPLDFPENRQNSEINWIYIRYAEVLLTYAEAKVEINDIDQTVLDAINKVRARAYGVNLSETGSYPAVTTLNQDELRIEVQYERKVELAMEGFRLFDIRRWEIADVVMNGTLIGRPILDYGTIPSPPRINTEVGHHPDYSEHQDLYRNVEPRTFNPSRDWLWPIPQAEINVNENIIQSPGY